MLEQKGDGGWIYFYRCKVAKTSKAAESKRNAMRLFALSESITGEMFSRVHL